MSTGVADSVKWSYDRRHDVFVLLLAEPTPSYDDEVAGVEGLHIRYDMKTDRVIGATILYFSRQDKNDLRKHLPFGFDFSQITAD